MARLSSGLTAANPFIFRHAIANTMIGVVLFFVVSASAVHYNGGWYAKFLPMSDSSTYDNTGAHYNVSRILTPEFTLNEGAYKSYSPLFLRYEQATVPSSRLHSLTGEQHNIRHVLRPLVRLHQLADSVHMVASWKDHLEAVQEQHHREARHPHEVDEEVQGGADLVVHVPVCHCKSMHTKLVVGLADEKQMLGLGFVAILFWPTNLTWWAFLLAVFISFSFALPIGIIQAVTNTQIGLNVLTEFIYGYIQPGRPLALMM